MEGERLGRERGWGGREVGGEEEGWGGRGWREGKAYLREVGGWERRREGWKMGQSGVFGVVTGGRRARLGEREGGIWRGGVENLRER